MFSEWMKRIGRRSILSGGNGKDIKTSIRRLPPLDVEYILPGLGDWISGGENVKADPPSLRGYEKDLPSNNPFH
jgi:hypothetical protein